MILRQCDPGEMTPDAREAELASILARGIRRLELVRGNGLDAGAEDERPCDHAAVDSRNHASACILRKLGFAFIRSEPVQLHGIAAEDHIFRYP